MDAEVKQSLISFLDLSWRERLVTENEESLIEMIQAFLKKEKEQKKVFFPAIPFIFNAFKKTPYDKVKVVILGQDPYHGEGQAHGLSFSVKKGVKQPPSLKNIFKELKRDLDITPPEHGCLNYWAQQGVLLLNTTLTVRKKEPLSHKGIGWECFTDRVIQKIKEKKEAVVFLLWGKHAQEKFFSLKKAKESANHLVLTASHPSPYSANRGFLGCGHFSKTNKFLKQRGFSPIDWDLKNESVPRGT